jgi:2-polyprenyl-3-methyl-5-hydroxy-6-metoxy-1,4-benzoquinol methylase
VQNTRINPEASRYYGGMRMSLLGLVEGKPRRVLEIGCGHGQVLMFLKSERSTEFVAGVELVAEVAEIARRNSTVDLVLTGDVEQIELDFPPEHFDLIIASHVLEHVKDPWSVIRRLRKLLRSGGQFIGSLPNVRNARISLPLVFTGKWQYTDEGILDWTHTRFFTKSTISDLLHSSGFEVQRIEPEFFSRSAMLNKLTLGLFKDLLCFTYNFSARQIDEECDTEVTSNCKKESALGMHARHS